jgi:hypothetical protein
VNAIIDDRTGNAKASRLDFFASEVRSRAARKFPDDEIELSEFLAGKAFTKDEFELAVLFREKSQIAFGTTHIASENHLASRAKPYIKPF